MASIVITINTDGAAFREGVGDEVSFILDELSDAYEANGTAPNTLRDSNGKVCGTVEVIA